MAIHSNMHTWSFVLPSDHRHKSDKMIQIDSGYTILQSSNVECHDRHIQHTLGTTRTHQHSRVHHAAAQFTERNIHSSKTILSRRHFGVDRDLTVWDDFTYEPHHLVSGQCPHIICATLRWRCCYGHGLFGNKARYIRADQFVHVHCANTTTIRCTSSRGWRHCHDAHQRCKI